MWTLILSRKIFSNLQVIIHTFVLLSNGKPYAENGRVIQFVIRDVISFILRGNRIHESGRVREKRRVSPTFQHRYEILRSISPFSNRNSRVYLCEKSQSHFSFNSEDKFLWLNFLEKFRKLEDKIFNFLISEKEINKYSIKLQIKTSKLNQ